MIQWQFSHQMGSDEKKLLDMASPVNVIIPCEEMNPRARKGQ